MADSTNPFDIPAGKFPIVAGYVDGRYAWPAAGWKYHDASLHVTIAVSSLTNAGTVLDVERYDATPAEAPGWVAMRRRAGVQPAIYASRSVIPTLEGAFRAVGEPFPLWWIAEWTGTPHFVGGSIATQYADSVMVGAHYDLSLVGDYWPGLDALPPPPATTGAGGAVENWNGLQVKVDVDIPAFGQQLGVIASGVENLG